MAILTKIHGHESAPTFTAIVASAFADHPITQRFICEKDSLASLPENPADPSRPFPVSRVIDHFTSTIISSLSAGGEIIEASDWAAAALWEPPEDRKPKVVGQSDVKQPKPGPVMTDYRQQSKEMREKWLGPDTPVWHLFMIARSAGREEKGVVRALMDPYLQRARENDIPVVLEATSEKARDMYIHFGFKLVEEFVVGKGNTNKSGAPEEGGEGIVVFFMLYHPRNDT